MTIKSQAIALGLALAGLATGAWAQATLQQVQARGQLVCGVSQGDAGFSNPDAQGRWTGLDADLCRAVAAAIFTADETISAYGAGRCDTLTTDSSQLAADRLKLANPEEHVILPDIISKEPLGPVVRQGDANWRDIVARTHFAMVTAEELGITQANIEQALRDARPEVRRFSGAEGNRDQMLGLSNDRALRIVRHVGNYGESFERNVGERSLLRLPRGANNLWTRGDLQYARPIR